MDMIVQAHDFAPPVVYPDPALGIALATILAGVAVVALYVTTVRLRPVDDVHSLRWFLLAAAVVSVATAEGVIAYSVGFGSSAVVWSVGVTAACGATLVGFFLGRSYRSGVRAAVLASLAVPLLAVGISASSGGLAVERARYMPVDEVRARANPDADDREEARVKASRLHEHGWINVTPGLLAYGAGLGALAFVRVRPRPE